MAPAETKRSPDEMASLFAAIEKINHRLDKLESGRTAVAPEPIGHPSLDKFSVAEAIADSIFAHYKKEKACQFEPGKPCDHCSMCNSRGF
ncbi:MAG: hypothetical protein IPM59_02270 [Chloracidobacterium sp.]|nr:hypothetical protein [Chloracidobacterium sp.]